MNTATRSQLVYKNSVNSTNQPPINERILIPYFSLYSDRLVIHPRPFNPIYNRKRNPKSDINLKKKKFTGKISKVQKSQIKKKLTAWLSSIEVYNKSEAQASKRKEHYPVFITLTLSSEQFHDDRVIKKRLLDLFIKSIKKEFGVSKYFWKSERQQNGNIHFHLIVDKYCSWFQLKQVWNRTQNVLGYIDKFEEKHKHRNPNSVDVRSAKNIDNFINYVLKYCLKDIDGKPIEGRVFGMSDELRKLSVFQDVLDSELGNYLEKYMDYDYFTVYRQEYATVLIFNKSFYASKFFNLLNRLSNKYYLETYHNIYSGQKKEIAVQKIFKEPLIRQESQLSMFKLSDQVSIIKSYNYINAKADIKYRKNETAN